MHWAVFLLLVAPSVAAQTRTVYVDVIDNKSGTQVESLRPQDFHVKVGKRDVTVHTVERKVLKPKVVVLFDGSGSMGRPAALWNTALDLATTSIKVLQPMSKVSFLPFSDSRLKPEVYLNPAEVLKSLESFRLSPHNRELATRGRTAMRDATRFALSEMKLGAGDVVLVISDGGDNASKSTKSELEKALLRSGVRLFAVVLGWGGQTPEEREGKATMAQLASKTGGTSVTVGQGANAFSGSNEFSIGEKEYKNIPTMIGYVARRIVSPLEMTLEVPADASGKLKIEVVDEMGKRRNTLLVSAPERVEVGQ